MKLDSFLLIFIFILITPPLALAILSPPSTTRRILHEPLFPASSTPPPDDDVTPLPPPPPDNSVAADPDQPFFPEIPNGAATQMPKPTPPPPPPSADASAVLPAATQPTKPVKKVAMVISVGIVTLGMLSALAFYIYRHKVKHPGDTQKLMNSSNSRNYDDESSRDPPSSFFYPGNVDSSNHRSEDSAIANSSPYHKLNSVKKLDRYRPSPDLQPLPPLRRQPIAPPSPAARASPTATVFSSSEDEGSRDANFFTPYGSGAGFDEGFSAPASKQSRRSSKNLVSHGGGSGMPFSKVTSSPRSRFSPSSPDVVKHAIIPSIKTTPPPAPQEPPGLQPLPPEKKIGPMTQIKSVLPTKVKFTTLPSPPNSALLKSISTAKVSPPPPPPPPMSMPPKVRSTWANAPLRLSGSSSKPQLQTTPEFQKEHLKSEEAKPKPNEDDVENGCSSSGRPNGDEMEGMKPKLKPLHWDKVRATSDRATVWDQLKSSSFQLNEDLIESLFGCNSISNNSSNSVNKDTTRRSVLPPVEQENRVLDPKKSQNIAILLRALNVTRDEVSQALLEGNPETLGAELLETLVKMAPTKEEEIKLKGYKGDTSKLGSAEKFLKSILDIPFAFKRVEAMLYRANFDAEVKYLRKSFDTLETASGELKNSRLFLKLLEAVLRTGNRMNVGTNRGDAKAFKLDTLLKLVDIKGTDGKTTFLHFVVQEIIKSETATEDLQNQTNSRGLQMVSGLSRELGSVKLAAGMDSDVLHSYVSKLETGLEKVKTVLRRERPDMEGRFFESMRGFLGKAEEEILRIKDDEKRALRVVREVTEYFHGNVAKEEAHPFRIFMIVKDFLSTLDQVCKEVGRVHDRSMTSARSFRMSTNVPLPVLNRYNVSQDDDWSEES